MSKRSDFEAFKNLGFAVGQFTQTTRAYRDYCAKKQVPFVQIVALKREFRIHIRLFGGLRFTGHGRALLLATLTEFASGRNQLNVGIRRARVCIDRSQMAAAVQSLTTIIATPDITYRPTNRTKRSPASQCDSKVVMTQEIKKHEK
jgi:hypothetical protein